MSELPEDLIRPREAARVIKSHIATIYRLITSGKLPAWKVGGARYLVSRQDVLALLQPVAVRQRVPAEAPSSARARRLREEHALEVLRRNGCRV